MLPSLQTLPDLTNSISPLLIVVGPTASGKSALALALAQEFGGEIVNADSLQIYRGMDIGSAKPSLTERQLVPHHLFDARNPDQVFTAGEYSRLGREILAEIAARGRLPVVTGGAGFYIRALTEGLFPGPQRSEEIRERLIALEARRPLALARILRCWDRAASEKIHANNTNKLVRALEIILHEKDTLTEAHRKERGKLEGFRIIKIGLNPPRDLLRSQITKRTQKMFDAGLLEEVKSLRAAGYGPLAKAMESVGYRQAQMVLDGQMGVQEAMAETTLRTCQYAKRQMTWFRKESEIQWLQGFGSDPEILAQARSHLKQFLLEFINFSSDRRNEFTPGS